MEHLYIDKYSHLHSFIHRLDPRVKFIAFLGFIFTILSTLPAENTKFIIYFSIIVILIIISRIPVKHFIKNFFILLPFILLIVLSATFYGSNVLKGIFIKSVFSILILTLLSSTTKFHYLIKALEKFKFPKILTINMIFMYRYIFVFIDEKMRKERAIKLKYFGKRNFLQFKTLGNIIGSMFIGAYERSERIYSAMCSRLFSGQINTIEQLKIKNSDIIFLISFIAILLVVRIFI
ncbi:MAG TPA: hypothetical protein DCP53_10140 [Elusimicrobia bacterium]|nr:hypothetical protein [Elusimicrobiota bacterium]